MPRASFLTKRNIKSLRSDENRCAPIHARINAAAMSYGHGSQSETDIKYDYKFACNLHVRYEELGRAIKGGRNIHISRRIKFRKDRCF